MDRQARRRIAQVLRAAAAALDGAGFGGPMDPVNIVNQINRQRRSWSPLVLYRIIDVMGNKRTFTVFFDGGRLRYVMRTNWGNRGYEVSPWEVEEALPKNVDRFSSVKAVANYITSLLKRYYKVVEVEQLEELD